MSDLLWIVRYVPVWMRGLYLFGVAMVMGGAVEAGANPAWLTYAAVLTLVGFLWVGAGENSG